MCFACITFTETEQGSCFPRLNTTQRQCRRTTAAHSRFPTSHIKSHVKNSKPSFLSTHSAQTVRSHATAILSPTKTLTYTSTTCRRCTAAFHACFPHPALKPHVMNSKLLFFPHTLRKPFAPHAAVIPSPTKTLTYTSTTCLRCTTAFHACFPHPALKPHAMNSKLLFFPHTPHKPFTPHATVILFFPPKR